MAFLPVLAKFLLQAGPVLACAVCGAGAEESSNNAFLKGTALLSLMPLGVIGTTIFYIYKRSKASQTDVLPGESPAAPVIDLR